MVGVYRVSSWAPRLEGMDTLPTCSPASSWENRYLPAGAKAQPAKEGKRCPWRKTELREGCLPGPEWQERDVGVPGLLWSMRLLGWHRWRPESYSLFAAPMEILELREKSLEGVALLKPTVPFSHLEDGCCCSCFLSCLWRHFTPEDTPLGCFRDICVCVNKL